MNVMFVIDGKVITAPLEGSVLPGVTRDSIIHILKDWGYEVEERELSIDELLQFMGMEKAKMKNLQRH